MLADESLVWFEKDITDFEQSDGEDASVAFFGEIEQNGQSSNDRAVKRRVRVSERHQSGGVVYPLDVWFVIGNHIRPEDVASFSAICHGSHWVVHTARFWSRLYKRFYTSTPTVDLPLFLGPSMLERVHGLKGRVVRSLFYFYLPFQNRLRCMAPFENDPDCLEGTRCIRMWYQQIKQTWHFYFKFERTHSYRCPIFPSRQASSSVDSLRAEVDALHNPEVQNVVLQVVSPSYVLLPEVVGQVLIKTFVSVGHEMRAHKLKLVFNPTSVHANKAVLSSGTTINIDPATNIHILHWWDPKYPCRF